MGSPLTIVVVARRDQTFGEFVVSVAHAASEAGYVRRRHEESSVGSRLELNNVDAIVKGARNEQKLLKLKAALEQADIPHVAVREEEFDKRGNRYRLAGQVTAIGIMPAGRERVAVLVNDFHIVEVLDGPK